MPLYRIRTNITGVSGTPWLGTLYFDSAGGTAAQAAAAVELFWNSVKSVMSSTLTIQNDGVAATVNEATGDVTAALAYTATALTGGAAGVMVPRAAQALVRWQTGVYFAGRERRGRTFIPGLTTAAVQAPGQVSATVRGTIDTAAATLVASANANLVVWSRSAGAFSPALSGLTWVEFATMRSRRD